MPCQTLEYKQTVLEETTGNAKAKSLQAEPAIWCFSCKGSRIVGTAKIFPDLGGCWGCFMNNAARLFFTCRKDRVGLDYVRLNQVYICPPNYRLTHSHQSLNYVSMDICQATSIICCLFDSNTLPIYVSICLSIWVCPKIEPTKILWLIIASWQVPFFCRPIIFRHGIGPPLALRLTMLESCECWGGPLISLVLNTSKYGSPKWINQKTKPGFEGVVYISGKGSIKFWGHYGTDWDFSQQYDLALSRMILTPNQQQY